MTVNILKRHLKGYKKYSDRWSCKELLVLKKCVDRYKAFFYYGDLIAVIDEMEYFVNNHKLSNKRKALQRSLF